VKYQDAEKVRQQGRERPGALLARRTAKGMEPDDLLCSRNARPEKALVGRAQWKINQPPSLRKEQAGLATPLKRCRENWKAAHNARSGGDERVE
jgi:hypothetical protein